MDEINSKLSWLTRFFSRVTWAQRFMLASLVILVLGMAGLGWWMGLQIESSVIHQSAAYTALYVSSIVEPNLQELATGDVITPEHQAVLDRLLEVATLGQHITAVKIWDKPGRIVYATELANPGSTLPMDSQLATALRGWVAADISNLNKPENINDRERGMRRLETYSPVRLTGTNQIIAAVEFYQTVGNLDQAIAAARERCWPTVGAVTVVMSNEEVAAQLYLSEKTVKHYLTNILQKLHVRNRVEAALVAQKMAHPPAVAAPR